MNKIKNKNQLSVITSDQTNNSEVDQFLTPIVGLKFMEQLIRDNENQKLLVVFDDVMKHHFMEKAVFQKAN
jgi:F0F1-type ATP synthase alpha subunit